MHRIHITGCGPRTGTTLLMEMLITCCDVDRYPEHEASVYRPAPRDAHIFLTKAPNEAALAGRALRDIGNLHVLYLLRDPRDMIASKHAVYPDRYWVGLNFWKCLAPFGRELEGHPRFVRIDFDRLVSDPDGVQASLVERMPFLRTTRPFSSYAASARPSEKALRALGGVRPPSPDNVTNWRNHLPRIAGQCARHGSIATDLIEFGFEADASWEVTLDDVEPDTRPSFWPDEWGLDEICPVPGLSAQRARRPELRSIGAV